MPLWGLSTAKRAAVELGSDDDRVSASTSSRSSSYSPTPASKPSIASPPPSLESPPNRVPATAAPAHRCSSGAAVVTSSRGFTSGAAARAAKIPMMLGVGTPQRLTVQAVHQRAMSLQQLQHRSSVCSSVNDPALNTPRAQSPGSSRGGSFAFTPQVLETHNTMNILVLGAPQVGKSLFINTYRAAVTNTTRWPAAPVGISGFYGTTTVEPFPNHPREPTWLCIDTPGRLYTAESEVILEKLTEGMPWKTKLLGPKALTLSAVADLTPIAANKAHQCVIVIPATDLIEDEGWMSVLLWRNRYRPTDDVAARILYTKNLISSLRALMNDVSPFVVVTKMDKFGGAGSRGACAAVTSVLSQCVPVNRIYFAAAVENRALLASGRAMVLERSTKQNLVRLHEDICLAVQWGHQIQIM
ncbi:hypothetical protein ABB37_00760 [Leptomonas pyrrhocoris]|uniref:Uncharacterized protein n=1 Tax=Leptomonas pyrrhocoris TaxID=157538 RepID=A0A0N0VHV3_LEPPY|nr:hypothetical protein ABB37_00760 [Leptomonas pyrrhocoris]KPA86658.1 hypothetical protein ABB37_00760 [Leptomonas pyrrhocoris]|eukprot:XP_015665097.1 hypothetical protein ABB37_00760 [Leptomonas pyrrhocoris]